MIGAMQQIIYITSHPKKAEQLSWHLYHPVTHLKLNLPEIQSLDPREVIRAKAEEAYHRLQKPVLVEDFSLRFEALGALPGPLIKWFLSALKPDGICKLLDTYPSRRATAQVYFALIDENGVHIFDGARAGTIANRPRGEAGYGTDGIFIPEGWEKTWAEMSKEEQIASSVRRISIQKLEEYLRSLK